MNKTCTICSRIIPTGTRCALHPKERISARPHRRIRAQLLATATVCAECGLPPTQNDLLTFDHVVPRAHGGATTLTNARAVHASCNSRLGARMVNL